MLCMQAHQWLGNMATLDDWTELWINEGMATYMEAVLADAYQPGMGYLTNFFTDTASEGALLPRLPSWVSHGCGCLSADVWAEG